MKPKWPNHFRVKSEIGSEDAKSYPDDIFFQTKASRLSFDPVGEALEQEDVEEPEDLAREYVIEIYVDKIYMSIFVDFKQNKV